MLKILHGFIDLIDSSASMDSPKSSPVYKCTNKQKELLYTVNPGRYIPVTVWVPGTQKLGSPRSFQKLPEPRPLII